MLIVLFLHFSDTYILFLRIPTIDKMFPDFGPASGGTYVTLTGSNLNIGVSRKLDLVFDDYEVIPFQDL